jgi:acyl carrier protein
MPDAAASAQGKTPTRSRELSADSSNTPIEAAIHDFLAARPDLLAGAGGRLRVDQSLISGGLIDSLAVLDIVAFLEERFAVRFEPEDLTGENFDNIAAMARLVRARGG